jgi:prepilin-type N-terminal cleavage/methylation domain-containing protein
MNFRNSKGLTLIEVLVAMAILTVIIAVTFDSLFTVIKARDISRERLQAMELSSSIMEEIKAYHSSWKNSSGLETWLTGNGYAKAGNVFSKVETDSNHIDYNIRVRINKNTGINGLFDISITAESPNASGINLITRIREV